MRGIGFNNTTYLQMQSERIRNQLARFGGKLYLEFGGKLFDDFHASRVLPGFEPDSKVKMLLEMKEEAEIIVAINADDLEKNRIRGDHGITYDLDALRLIDAFREIGLFVGSVVITKFQDQPAARKFEKRLTELGVKVYRHYPIDDYPTNISLIISDEGYGKNDYIETERQLVIVTASGSGSGKMAACLSQLYHEHIRGRSAGYAKFETFPVWNLPLSHPVNLAYEAATVDLNDVNMIDPFHLEAYAERAVNYNRDIEVYPVLRAILSHIWNDCPYKSPTDMGVNMIGYCITNDEIVSAASKQEIIRRYYRALCEQRQGAGSQEEVYRMELLMKGANISTEDRPVVAKALQRAEETNAPAVAMELDDGTIIIGKTSSLIGASAAVLLNALKYLGGISHEIPLISPIVIEPIQHLKVNHMGNRNPRLHTDEILIALSICAATNPTAALALEQLTKLKGCEAHSSILLSRVDENTFNKLGVNLTCEPKYETRRLYRN